MHEGQPAEEIQPTWDPNSGVPPPMTLEYGFPPPLSQATETWDPNSGVPPPFTPEFGALVPPPLPAELAPPDPQDIAYEGVSEMQERAIANPELLSEKEASKKFLAEERQKLAEEIRAERRRSRDKLGELTARTEIEGIFPVEGGTDVERMAKNYDALTDMRAGEANGIAERLAGSEMSEEDVTEERENIKQLVDNDDKLKILRQKLTEHYSKADGLAKEKFEKIQKSVEQALARNNAFLVHTFTTHKDLRHNANSNITGRATLEDDIDLLLSLEPSISTSSITPGLKTSLFQEEFGNIGVIVGGGDIDGATHTDAGSISTGIKRRRIIGENDVSVEKIDEVIGQRKDGDGYNEIVVNNPKVFGIFKSVQEDESGKMMGNPKYFEQYVRTATQKGIPPYVMTPDRRLFEFISIDDDGTVIVGAEITPEQVATGRAGLPSEKRKEIGDEILQKNLFKNVNAQREAKEIIASLSEQQGEIETQLSNEEYLTQLKNNPGEIYQQLVNFPEALRGDKQFMLESANIDAVSTYQNATEELKKDIDFVKHIYAQRSTQQGRTMSPSYLPVELRKDPQIAMLSIDCGDLDGLDASFALVPEVWQKIEDRIIENRDPQKWFSREVGEAQILTASLFMQDGERSVDFSERLLTNHGFVDKLNQRYPNFKFEVDEYRQLLVTKLG
ncbi:MAG: hypothetical protein UY04_C0012G0022 [Parcubacteria group bacterium GW2011_GWA2_47_7]|nr:MAG: hypothetical protein UY04_C0012G0022 [Parcubacteria group bacterium GW2011_GWA2_47_7]